MINILEPGKKQKKQRVIYTVVCQYCGCKFECELEDFKALSKSIENPLAMIDCPNCGLEIQIDRKTTLHRIIEEQEIEE